MQQAELAREKREECGVTIQEQTGPELVNTRIGMTYVAVSNNFVITAQTSARVEIRHQIGSKQVTYLLVTKCWEKLSEVIPLRSANMVRSAPSPMTPLGNSMPQDTLGRYPDVTGTMLAHG